MLCAFDGPPRIVRFHGRGTVVIKDEPGFDDLLATGGFEDASLPAARRAIVDVDVTRVSDSCGYLVPRMGVEGRREHHQLSTAKRLRTAGLDGYWEHRLAVNATSIDGLPALGEREPARRRRLGNLHDWLGGSDPQWCTARRRTTATGATIMGTICGAQTGRRSRSARNGIRLRRWRRTPMVSTPPSSRGWPMPCRA